jgi:hypothetical protein
MKRMAKIDYEKEKNRRDKFIDNFFLNPKIFVYK